MNNNNMEKIPWTADFSLGIPVIDKQHKEFVNILNCLYDCIFAIDKQTEIHDQLDRLGKYAVYHFATEEKYFAKFGYKDTKEHVRVHTEMRNQVENLIARYNNKEDVLMELFDFVEDWLVNHLAEQDRLYVECFKKNGL